jgi:hypothetical protein
MYPLAAIKFIGGQSKVLFTWVIIIGLVNNIWGVSIILVVAIGNVELPFNFLRAKTSHNPLPNFVANAINIPLLTTSMVDTITVSTHVVVIPTSSDLVTITPIGCLWVSTIATSNMLVKLCWFEGDDVPFYGSHWYPLWCRMWMWIHF